MSTKKKNQSLFLVLLQLCNVCCATAGTVIAATAAAAATVGGTATVLLLLLSQTRYVFSVFLKYRSCCASITLFQYIYIRTTAAVDLFLAISDGISAIRLSQHTAKLMPEWI